MSSQPVGGFAAQEVTVCGVELQRAALVDLHQENRAHRIALDGSLTGGRRE